MKDKIINLLGLIRRANKMVMGETILEYFAKGKIHYVIIASDASDKTKERYLKKCDYYHIAYETSLSSDDLAHAVGRNNVKTIGITDEGFAKSLLKIREG